MEKKRAIDLSIPSLFIIGLLGNALSSSRDVFSGNYPFPGHEPRREQTVSNKIHLHYHGTHFIGNDVGNWYDTLFLTGTFTVGIPKVLPQWLPGLTGFVGIHLTKH